MKRWKHFVTCLLSLINSKFSKTAFEKKMREEMITLAQNLFGHKFQRYSIFTYDAHFLSLLLVWSEFVKFELLSQNFRLIVCSLFISDTRPFPLCVWAEYYKLPTLALTNFRNSTTNGNGVSCRFRLSAELVIILSPKKYLSKIIWK